MQRSGVFLFWHEIVIWDCGLWIDGSFRNDICLNLKLVTRTRLETRMDTCRVDNTKINGFCLRLVFSVSILPGPLRVIVLRGFAEAQFISWTARTGERGQSAGPRSGRGAAVWSRFDIFSYWTSVVFAVRFVLLLA